MALKEIFPLALLIALVVVKILTTAVSIGTGFGGGTLVSAGGGLRARLDDFDFAIEAATPLTNIRLESADKSPQINLHTGLRF